MTQSEALYITDLETMLQDAIDILNTERLEEIEVAAFLTSAEKLLDLGLDAYETFEEAD